MKYVDPIKILESVISRDPEAFLKVNESVYQITESEVIEFARQILDTKNHTAAQPNERADGGVLCSDGWVRYPNKPSLMGYD